VLSLTRVCCSLVVTTSSTGSGLLSLHTAGLLCLDDRGSGVLDVLLGGSSNNERWDVDHLLADGDVSSSDQDASVVNRRGELALEHEGLKASFHQLRDSESEHVIELALRLLEQTKSDHASDDGLA
jgi:hypothetical protein